MPRRSLLAALTCVALLACSTAARAQNAFTENDLVSDLSGRANAVDSNLVNPWGLVPSAGGVFWSSNNGTGTSTLYRPDGSSVGLVVQIPNGANTGIDVTLAGSPAFEIPNADTTARALFVFVSETGTLSAWSNRVDATHAIVVATVTDAVYKGATIADTPAGPRLYATDFHDFRIDAFDHAFHRITLPGSFTDPNLPAGYSPFNVQNIAGRLVVAFALKEADGDDEEAGAGFGFVDLFDTDGHLLRRLVSEGALNAPWGLALAPPTFGAFGGKLLVGNFGDGRINAYSLASGAPAGALEDGQGDPISIDGLWGLHFGVPASGPAVANRLYFTAGLDEEAHGLFGYLAPAAGEICARRTAHDDDGEQGRDDEDSEAGDGTRGGPRADSLRALLACATLFSRSFGPSGCFVANLELLHPHGHESARDRLARAFLSLELDRCAGRVCDSTVVTCGAGKHPDDSDRRESGHERRNDALGGRHDAAAFTVAQIVALIDANLCGLQSGDSLATLTALAQCAIRSGAGGDNDSGDGDSGDDATAENPSRSASGAPPAIEVRALGGNPVRLSAGLGARFVVTTTGSTPARLDVYDAAGRLVAQPLRAGSVAGTSVIRWDGTDLRGGRVASGTYFYRASAGNSVTGGRIVVVH